MKKITLCSLLLFVSFVGVAQSFSLRSVLSYPFPSQLVAAPKGSKLAWAVNEQGKRNVYVAEAPAYEARKLTDYTLDDGQELTSVSISADGNWVVFVRGGDHGGKDAVNPVNALSAPVAPKVQVMSVPFSGGPVNVIAEGDIPVVSPNSDQLVFIKSGQMMISPINGHSPAKALFYAKGINGQCKWSPDGKKIAFVSNRSDHAFIGVYTDVETPIQWMMPAFSKDAMPVWSADSEEIAFIRLPGSSTLVDSILARKHQPWAICVSNLKTGLGKIIWKAPETLRGSYPSIDGGANLIWTNNRIVFMSYEDGWPHLYSINKNGTEHKLLTPGAFAVENIKVTTDQKRILFCANQGAAKEDIDRRHIFSVSVGQPDVKMLSAGVGIESYPVGTEDGTISCLSSNAKQPLMAAILKGKEISLLGKNLMPADFPMEALVTPSQIVFNAADGKPVYGQLFTPKNPKKGRGAVLYVHGGPQRQMMLGWNPMDYYSIDYALNQYLTQLGFTVLSINYRLGLGYGYDFHKPERAGAQGASEYQDVHAAGEWLAQQPGIDPKRIGIYGGSYGGYLVALALGKDSKLFAAGVDIHGVNNRFSSGLTDGAPDLEFATKIAAESSPMNYMNTWTSPTLIIHADDDRNVSFSQSVDLARRFEDKKFDFEYLAIPDDTHHWMKFSNALRVSEATAVFLKKHLDGF